MKIVVFGAAGGVGRACVRRAKETGFAVTAFVRNPESFDIDGVRVVAGDAFDADAVAQAIVGHDVVVSALGSSTGTRSSTELERMATNIADGMVKAGVNRVVYCASAGVHGELTGLIGKSVMWMLRHPLADHRYAIEKLTNAGLKLTVARPTSLTNSGHAGSYDEHFDGIASSRAVSRIAVADFMVHAILNSDTYVGTSVGLSGSVSAAS